MELQLLDDDLRDERRLDLYVVAAPPNSRYEEHERVLEQLTLRCHLPAILGLLHFDDRLDCLVDDVEDLQVARALLQASHLVAVHFHECLLGLNVLVWLLVDVERENELEKALWVKVKEPSQEL